MFAYKLVESRWLQSLLCLIPVYKLCEKVFALQVLVKQMATFYSKLAIIGRKNLWGSDGNYDILL